jgi:hypothetical protein
MYHLHKSKNGMVLKRHIYAVQLRCERTSICKVYDRWMNTNIFRKKAMHAAVSASRM